MAWRSGDRGPGRARDYDSQSIHAWCRQGGAGAYKNVSAVVEASQQAGLARKVAKLKPLICIKG